MCHSAVQEGTIPGFLEYARQRRCSRDAREHVEYCQAGTGGAVRTARLSRQGWLCAFAWLARILPQAACRFDGCRLLSLLPVASTHKVAISGAVITALGAICGLVALPAAVQAQTDLPGARDPDGIPRFPRSWVVFFEQEDNLVPREFIVSAVEKIRRELRIDEKLRVDATALRVTYQVPSGTPREEVVDHYRRALGADALFSCEGFDCGRSNAWASQVYEQALLYGPDRNQFYIAADRVGKLVSASLVSG